MAKYQKYVGAFHAKDVLVSVSLRFLASSARPLCAIENGTLLTSEDFLKFMASSFCFGAGELLILGKDFTVVSPKPVLISGLFPASTLPRIEANGKWERFKKS